MKRLLVLILLVVPTLAKADSIFHPNRRNLYVFAGKSMTGRIGQADIEAINYEMGHAISPRTEFGSVLALMNIRQLKSGYGDQYGPGSRDVPAISSSLFVRRHFGNESGRFRPFVELSSGPLYSRYRVPAGTSRFNFISQGGVGVTFHPNRRYGIIAGWRFGHISNGGIEPDKNPGYNINVVVIGVQFDPMPR
jgi:hypothetical protein